MTKINIYMDKSLKILMSMLILMSLPIISACSKSDDEETINQTELLKKELVGDWHGEIYDDEKPAESYLTFCEDGNFKFSSTIVIIDNHEGGQVVIIETFNVSDAEYEIANSTLSITYRGDNGDVKTGTYSISIESGLLKLVYKSGVKLWGSVTTITNENTTEVCPDVMTYIRQ